MVSTCFGHLHVHLQEFLYTKVVSLPHVVLCPRCCGCGPTELTLYIRTPEDGHVNVRNM